MNVRQTVDLFCPPALRGFKRRVEASSLVSRLVRGTFWSLVGTVVSRALGLLASILVARVIGKVGLGQSGDSAKHGGNVQHPCRSGAGSDCYKTCGGASRQQSFSRGRDNRTLKPHFVGKRAGDDFGDLVSGALAWPGTFSAAPALAPALQCGSLLLAFWGRQRRPKPACFPASRCSRALPASNLICGVANFPIMVCGAYFAGLPGAVWGLVASLALNCGLNFLASADGKRSRRGCCCHLPPRPQTLAFTLAFRLAGNALRFDFRAGQLGHRHFAGQSTRECITRKWAF